ncbi:pyruvate kinase [Gynuella sp.]|uniref:pyruvate kinase n=1 Tax=Gynuella sp. TaxID=2969146 RepID=UPI003D12666C
MTRRTKIVTTLGPATDNYETLEQLILAGANVVRLNFSHGSPEDHKRRADWVREISEKHSKYVAILGDLQGPKIRISRFKDKNVELLEGQDFLLDIDLDKDSGDNEKVGVDYQALAKDCAPGDILLLDDGRVRLEVKSVEGNKILTKVVLAGPLSNNKGINKLGGGLSAPALTEKDKADIVTASEIGVDYVAVSFPRNAADINQARELLATAGSSAEIIAKIERAETVLDHDLLDEIILASDGVMVARGDLGVEIGDPQLIGVQKHIIERSRILDRTVITATQMMESMINNPFPTRAEVFDVANAVLDGTDAVMCSAETAAGKYPVETVRVMHDVCLGAEKVRRAQRSKHRLDEQFKRTDEAIAMSVMYTANHLKGVKAIICLTESGSTPLWMSRISSGIPIYALSRHMATLCRVALYRGVTATSFDVTTQDPVWVNRNAVETLKKQNLVSDGDLVIISKGDHHGVHGGTNTMQILSVGNIT